MKSTKLSEIFSTLKVELGDEAKRSVLNKIDRIIYKKSTSGLPFVMPQSSRISQAQSLRILNPTRSTSVRFQIPIPLPLCGRRRDR